MCFVPQRLIILGWQRKKAEFWKNEVLKGLFCRIEVAALKNKKILNKKNMFIFTCSLSKDTYFWKMFTIQVLLPISEITLCNISIMIICHGMLLQKEQQQQLQENESVNGRIWWVPTTLSWPPTVGLLDSPRVMCYQWHVTCPFLTFMV